MESKVFASLYCIQQIAKPNTKKQTLANFFTKCKPAQHVALVKIWMLECDCLLYVNAYILAGTPFFVRRHTD